MSIQRTAPQWNRLKNPYIETIRLMYIPVGNMLVRKAIADGIMKLYLNRDKSEDGYNIYTFDWNKHNPFIRAEQRGFWKRKFAIKSKIHKREENHND